MSATAPKPPGQDQVGQVVGGVRGRTPLWTGHPSLPPGIAREGPFSALPPVGPGFGIFHLLRGAVFQHFSSFAAYGGALTHPGAQREGRGSVLPTGMANDLHLLTD